MVYGEQPVALLHEEHDTLQLPRGAIGSCASGNTSQHRAWIRTTGTTSMTSRDWLSPAQINALREAERRLGRDRELTRAVIDRIGHRPHLVGRVGLDDHGSLWRIDLPHSEPLVLVELENSTVEPDGTRKRYFLRVPPNLRSAREAVAWTFGLSADDYYLEAAS